ncbi:unnamed protein product, partial [Ilex paraguariensis]
MPLRERGKRGRALLRRDLRQGYSGVARGLTSQAGSTTSTKPGDPKHTRDSRCQNEHRELGDNDTED